MFSIKLRLTFLLIMMVFTTGSLIIHHDLAFILSFTTVLLIIYTYFKVGTIGIALYQIQQGNYKKAKELIGQMKFKRFMNSKYKGIYYLTMGYIELNEEHYEESKQFFIKSLNYELYTDLNLFLVYINLANIEMILGNLEQVRFYIDLAKVTPHNAPLNHKFEQIENQMTKI